MIEVERLLPWSGDEFIVEKTLYNAIHGVVTLQKHKPSNTMVAVKSVSVDSLIGFSANLENLASEIEHGLLFSQAPFCLGMYGVFIEDKVAHIVSEYAPGGDLFNYLDKLGSDDIRRLTSQLLCALEQLHMRGYAHRDISLENVFIAADGSIRLADFAQSVKWGMPPCGNMNCFPPSSEIGSTVGGSTSFAPSAYLSVNPTNTINSNPYQQQQQQHIQSAIFNPSYTNSLHNKDANNHSSSAIPFSPHSSILNHQQTSSSNVSYLHHQNNNHTEAYDRNSPIFDRRISIASRTSTCNTAALPNIIHKPITGNCGKNYYRAPEVYGYQSYDPRCVDIFACGVVMFLLLVGIPPWDAADDKDARYLRVKREGVGSLIKKWKVSFPDRESFNLPDDAIDILELMLNPDPSKRPSARQCRLHPFFSRAVDSAKVSRLLRFPTKYFKRSPTDSVSSLEKKFKMAPVQLACVWEPQTLPALAEITRSLCFNPLFYSGRPLRPNSVFNLRPLNDAEYYQNAVYNTLNTTYCTCSNPYRFDGSGLGDHSLFYITNNNNNNTNKHHHHSPPFSNGDMTTTSMSSAAVHPHNNHNHHRDPNWMMNPMLNSPHHTNSSNPLVTSPSGQPSSFSLSYNVNSFKSTTATVSTATSKLRPTPLYTSASKNASSPVISNSSKKSSRVSAVQILQNNSSTNTEVALNSQNIQANSNNNNNNNSSKNTNVIQAHHHHLDDVYVQSIPDLLPTSTIPINLNDTLVLPSTLKPNISMFKDSSMTINKELYKAPSNSEEAVSGGNELQDQQISKSKSITRMENYSNSVNQPSLSTIKEEESFLSSPVKMGNNLSNNFYNSSSSKNGGAADSINRQLNSPSTYESATNPTFGSNNNNNNNDMKHLPSYLNFNSSEEQRQNITMSPSQFRQSNLKPLIQQQSPIIKNFFYTTNSAQLPAKVLPPDDDDIWDGLNEDSNSPTTCNKISSNHHNSLFSNFGTSTYVSNKPLKNIENSNIFENNDEKSNLVLPGQNFVTNAFLHINKSEIGPPHAVSSLRHNTIIPLTSSNFDCKKAFTDNDIPQRSNTIHPMLNDPNIYLDTHTTDSSHRYIINRTFNFKVDPETQKSQHSTSITPEYVFSKGNQQTEDNPTKTFHSNTAALLDSIQIDHEVKMLEVKHKDMF